MLDKQEGLLLDERPAEESPPQTETETEAAELVIQPEGAAKEGFSQTETDSQANMPAQPEDPIEDVTEPSILQTEMETAAGTPPSPQTETEKPKRSGRRKKITQNPSQSDTDPRPGAQAVNAEEAASSRPKRVRTKPAAVLTIDGQPTVETEADKAKNDLLDLLESQKSGRILTGTIQGVERTEGSASHPLAVIYHGSFKVIIPAEEAVEPPEDYRGRLPEDVLHYMLTKRLGAEVDYIVKGIDIDAGIAAASRLDAMRQKRKQYYLGLDREGNYLLYSDLCAEARIVSVIRAGIFVDLFGLEIYIPLRELSYQRWMDAAAHFQPGQRVLVKVLEVDRSDRNHIKAAASVKQAGKNPYELALRRYSVDNCYVGTVSMVDTHGVFVALDGGIDCLCSYPKRGRPPRGSRVTVRILGINHDANRIWGAITHIAAPR